MNTLQRAENFQIGLIEAGIRNPTVLKMLARSIELSGGADDTLVGTSKTVYVSRKAAVQTAREFAEANS